MMLEGHVEILDREVCYEGFLRLERYRLRHALFEGEWSAPLTRECLALNRDHVRRAWDGGGG